MENIDIAILRRCAMGDELAFRQLVEHYQRYAYSVAFRMLGSKTEAEDVVQECFVKVWRKLGSFDMEKKFSTWLFKIITNACIDFIRKQGGNGLTTDFIHTSIQHPDPFASRDLVEKVHQLTLHLPEKQRAVFVLIDLEGFENQEAAEMLGVPTDNIKSNLYQARRTIRNQLTTIINFKAKGHDTMQ